jgi:hypothetical protein
MSTAKPITKDGFWKRHKGVITIMSVFGLVLLVRAIFTGSIYPASTGDTANHLAVIDAMSKGDWGTWAYLGEVIVGLPVLGVSKLFGLDTADVFLVAEYLLLFGIGCTLYFVVSSLVNKKAAILVVLLAVLCTPSIFRLFSSGTIFSIVNMYLILPFVLFFTVRWFTTKQKRFIAAAAVITALFGVFHPNSLMFLFAMGLFTFGYMIYRRVKGYDGKEAITTLLVGIGLVGVLMLVSWITQPEFVRLFDELGVSVSGTFTSISEPIGIRQFVFDFITFAPLAVLCAIGVGLIQYRKSIAMAEDTKLFLMMLASFLPFLIIGTFSNIAIDCWRHAIELSVILSILTACLAGILLTCRKSMVFTVIVLGITACGMIPTLSTFFEFQGV